ncbi:ATP-binding cassette domain-containing protein [Desulfobacter postgatei]|uniref:ATP-binding cassette domain-containing protein n=1 Tax=Desulfobacter postgatei TaxID=2293 RepID=UPI00259BB28F|nr:ATP-binding cassette domain-containing protein [uncultured Desulfobacter sp.]
MTLEPPLEINDLCLEYRQNDLVIPVLDRVNLSLAPGKTLGLIGESGCGKTSLAMADLILTLQQHLGFAMILISHAMPAITRMTENIVTLYAGQVIEAGPTQAVLAETPATPIPGG